MFKYPEAVQKVIDTLKTNGFDAYLAGGCVRDFLIGTEPHDYDIASNALPEQTMSLFSDCKIIPAGLKHGTVIVVSDGMPLEITTFRTDGKYTDNRRPESVQFAPSYKDDAMRRDFTINAMAYNSYDGLLDYFGGTHDIKNKIIRCVGNPDERFTEDALRILRALRFASVLGFELEPSAASSAIKNKSLLNNISPERIREEFIKLLCGKNVKEVLLNYSDIISVFIPEIVPMIGFQQNNRHHIYDVWTHTVYAVADIPPVPHLRLAAFFHDFGKPETFAQDANGEGHFYGHAEYSLHYAEDIMKRLKFDNDTLNKVLKLIKYHDLTISNNKKLIKRQMNKMSAEAFLDLIRLFQADNSAKHPMYASRREHFDALESSAKEILCEQSCFSLSSLAVNGNDLLNIGIPCGKPIGSMLNKLLDLVIGEQLENNKRALLEYAEQHKTDE